MPDITHRIPGLVLTDHRFDVPLDYAQPDGDTISVFAREVQAAGETRSDLPWIVFLQGGPGFPSPRPTENGGWLKRALRDYRVLLLDQRGTGLSTPVTSQTLARFGSPDAMAAYLRHFRADAIVRDAEWIRRQVAGDEPWSVLGQSFGGFCAVTYLSIAPEGLREVLITGGLPPLDRGADEIYRATYTQTIAKNRQYYDRYPDDREQAQRIVRYLADHDVRLPGGDRLTPRRFQQLGHGFGASDGFEELHYLIEEAFVDGVDGPELSYTFLHHAENMQSYDTNPIYAILHEAIYCQGSASNWAAERVRGEFAEFDLSPDRPVFFTGEMIYPWMFDEYGHLRPLKAAAELLAADDRWPMLYDPARLYANTVPVAAAIYHDDMYVARQFSIETANAIRGCRVWITNQYEHNGLRADGEAIVDRLLGIVRGLI
jgi:pimeloyl-ACP methyl ester carboxylesterase